MNKTYLTKMAGAVSLIFSVNATALEKNEIPSLQQSISEGLQRSFNNRNAYSKCSLEKRFNQKYLYVYEPIGESYSWRIKPQDNGGMLQFTYYWGGKNNARPFNKRRACRPDLAHGGLVGAFFSPK